MLKGKSSSAGKWVKCGVSTQENTNQESKIIVCMNLKTLLCEDTIDHILYDSIYKKYPERLIYGYKAWGVGTVIFGGDKHVLKLIYWDCCTAW